MLKIFQDFLYTNRKIVGRWIGKNIARLRVLDWKTKNWNYTLHAILKPKIYITLDFHLMEVKEIEIELRIDES